MSLARDLADGVINGLTPQASNMQPFNRIINGAMTIDQRNAGASLGGNEWGWVVDRFKVYSATNACAVQRSTTAPAGFTNSSLYTQTGTGAVSAGDFGLLFHRIEGYNIADLGWGTANAETITISFWVRSSLTGTFGFTLLNSPQNRRFTTSYTINSANTFEYKTITILGDTTGTWLTDSNEGLGLYWDMGVGSTYSTTSGATWGTGTKYGLTGGTKVCATTGATFYITGVQLEAGSTASPFAHEFVGDTLRKCQRYYTRLGNDDGSYTHLMIGSAEAATTYVVSRSLSTMMRAVPTLTVGSGVKAYTASAGGVFVNSFSTRCSRDIACISAYVGGTSTLGQAAVLYDNGANGHIELDAEL